MSRISRSIATQTETTFPTSTSTPTETSTTTSQTSTPTATTATNTDPDAAQDIQQANTMKLVALVALLVIAIGFSIWALHRHKLRKLKSTRQRRSNRALRRDVELSRWRTLFQHRSDSAAPEDNEDGLPEYEGKLPNYTGTAVELDDEDLTRAQSTTNSNDIPSVPSQTSFEAIARTRQETASPWRTDTETSSIA